MAHQWSTNWTSNQPQQTNQQPLQTNPQRSNENPHRSNVMNRHSYSAQRPIPYDQAAQAHFQTQQVQPIEYQAPPPLLNAILNETKLTNSILQKMCADHDRMDVDTAHNKHTITEEKILQSLDILNQKITKSLDLESKKARPNKHRRNEKEEDDEYDEDELDEEDDDDVSVEDKRCATTSYADKQLILYNAIKHQTCQIAKLRIYLNKEKDEIKEAFNYWRSLGVLSKHGTGYRLPDTLKSQTKINKNRNEAIKQLLHDLGPIKVVKKSYSGKKRMKSSKSTTDASSDENENSNEDEPELKKAKHGSEDYERMRQEYKNEVEAQKMQLQEYKNEFARMRKEQDAMRMHANNINAPKPVQPLIPPAPASAPNGSKSAEQQNPLVLPDIEAIHVPDPNHNTRYRYSLWTKIQAIRRFEELRKHVECVTECQRRVAEEIGCDRSCISRWFAKRDEIYHKAHSLSKNKKQGTVYNKKQLKLRKSVGNVRRCMFPLEEDILWKAFQVRRKRGQKVNGLWIKTKFRLLLNERKPNGYRQFKYSNGWMDKFKQQHNIVKRIRCNKKRTSLRSRNGLLQKFHGYLHEIRNSQPFEPQQCAVYGRFSAENTYVFDEIPMPFVFDQETTLEIKGTIHVYIKSPGNGLDKRQFTAGLTFRGAGVQHITPTIIFRGKGVRIPEAETVQYPPRLNIQWQQRAWMDGVGMIHYLRHYDTCRMNDDCGEDKAHLILDNDTSHQTDLTKECAWNACNTLLTFTPANCTDAVSVVDRIAHLFKYDVKCEYEAWVELHFHEWETMSLSASDRRILFANWVWNAWQKLKERKTFIQKMFVECGILLKKDGSDKNKIHIPGFEEYKVNY